MQQSDFSNTSSGGRFRTIAVICGITGFLMLSGLAAYTWHLQQQIQALREENQPSALQSLFDSTELSAGNSTRGFNSNPVSPALPGNSAPAAADPFQQMEQIRQQMDAMMSSVFGGPAPSISGIPGLNSFSGNLLPGNNALISPGMNQPTLNLRETDERLELVIPVQDGQVFELSTDVQEDRLTVSGTLSWQQQSTQQGVVSERRVSSRFSRTVVLPDNVDPTGLLTEHRDNEIVISLPKV